MSGSDPGSRPRTESPDLRLLPLVAGMWVSQALVLGRPSGAPVHGLVGGAGLLALAAILTAGVSGWSMRSTRRGAGAADRPLGPVRPPTRRVCAATLLLVLAGAGIGLLVGSGHLLRLHPPLLVEVASDEAVIRAGVRITSDPQRHPAHVQDGHELPESWSVAASLQRVTYRGASYTTGVPILLRGDEVQSLRYGQAIDLTGRASLAYAPAQHALTLRVLGAVQQRAPPGRVAAATTRIRSAFATACAGLGVDAAALLMGLAIGDESLMTPDLDHAMLVTGLSHLTAVSGSNTSLVAGIALAGAAALGLGWRWRVASGVLVLAAYVALVRPQPSVLRAAVMGLVGLLALSAGGRRRGPPALLASVLALLLVLPQFAVAIGFALSVAATGGLLLVGPGLSERLARWPATRRVPEPLRAALAVAAAAHLATLPLVILLGNGASLVALPANVLVTPLVPVATVIGLAAALLSPALPGVGAVLAHVAAPATQAIAWVAHTSAALPHGVLPVPGGGMSAGIAAVVLVTVGWAVHRGWVPWRDRRVLIALVVVGLGLTGLRARLDARWPPTGWVVLACDVGQGDGLLLRRPGATDALLVDTGPEPGPIAACLADSGVSRLVVLLTHYHADHTGGLETVLAGWAVEQVLVSAVDQPPGASEEVTALAAQYAVPVSSLAAGRRLELVGLAVSVLWPARSVAQAPQNNASVVALAQIPTIGEPARVLLTGDVEPLVQSILMAGPSPRADVVKVAHHGSRYQDPGFASWAGAEVALISVGRDNDFGHPAPATILAYQRAGARVGRTDRNGALAVLGTGGAVTLLAQR